MWCEVAEPEELARVITTRLPWLGHALCTAAHDRLADGERDATRGRGGASSPGSLAQPTTLLPRDRRPIVMSLSRTGAPLEVMFIDSKALLIAKGGKGTLDSHACATLARLCWVSVPRRGRGVHEAADHMAPKTVGLPCMYTRVLCLATRDCSLQSHSLLSRSGLASVSRSIARLPIYMAPDVAAAMNRRPSAEHGRSLALLP